MSLSSSTSRFDYRVRVNRRARQVRITVSHEGEVVVIVPRPVPDALVRELLVGHEAWIDARLDEWRQRLAALSPDQGLQPDAIHLQAVDQYWPVEYAVAAGRGQWQEREAPRRLQLRAAAHEPQARTVLQQWLQHRARQVLPPWLAQVGERLGLRHTGVTIRAQKTRWGSCSSRGNINLNRNLLFLPPSLVEYLLVHELCHLREPNHSPRYWALVEAALPDYRGRDRALREAVDAVPLWARPGG